MVHDGRRKERAKAMKFTAALSQIAPSFFGALPSKGQSVMSEGSTFDHSARHEPAIPGFPVLISRLPHIRTGHESTWVDRAEPKTDAIQAKETSSTMGMGISATGLFVLAMTGTKAVI